MLNFMKKVLKKDNDALLETHAKDYFNNILPQVYDLWADEDVLNRLGVGNLIKKAKYVHDCTNRNAEYFQVNPKLTKEELVDCLTSLNEMCYYAEQMLDAFVKRYILEHPEVQKSFDEYVESKYHFEHEFRYHNDDYLVDVLKRLYEEIAMSEAEKLEVRNKLLSETKENLMKKPIGMINAIIMANMLTARVMATTVHSHLVLTNNDTKIKSLMAKRDAHKSKV